MSKIISLNFLLLLGRLVPFIVEPLLSCSSLSRSLFREAGIFFFDEAATGDAFFLLFGVADTGDVAFFLDVAPTFDGETGCAIGSVACVNTAVAALERRLLVS